MALRLGENIRTLRRDAGLTQEQLAEALGVTSGAVYKWESGRAAPELELLVEVARFFETSVDALLGYGWERMDMGRTAETLRGYITDKRPEEGLRLAEQALLRYPNSFRIAYESAELYFLTMKPEHAARAVELYRRALELIDQNEDGKIGPATLRSRIAGCLCLMDRQDEAIRLLKENNVGGANDGQIGLLLSRDAKNADEALRYLSDALLACYSQLYNICIGYANAYEAQRRPEKITALILWLRTLGRGLRDTGTVTWMDRLEAPLDEILAEAALLGGDPVAALGYLTEARETALRFDAAPEHSVPVGMLFWHGEGRDAAYDDLDETAMGIIESSISQASEELRALWARVSGDGGKNDAEK